MSSHGVNYLINLLTGVYFENQYILRSFKISKGTREVQTKKTKKEMEEDRKEAEENRKKQAKSGIMGFLSGKDELDQEGSLSFSFANLFTCIFCTYPKSMVSFRI